jgi:hypothetical protein
MRSLAALIGLLLLLPLSAGRVEVGEMDIYFGNLHSHTSYSDGAGTPEEAFLWARDAGLDFYAITDHAEMTSDKEWKDIGERADQFYEPGSFVTIRGFEWSQPMLGHMNVWGTDDYTGAVRTPTLEGMYDWIDEHNALAEFNHPGKEEGPFVEDFNDMEFYNTAADNMVGIERGSKNTIDKYYEYYPKALQNGWTLGPANNWDNHELNTTYPHRTAIIASELTREGLHEALAQKRFYSTDDSNLRVMFRCNGEWMGSVVYADQLSFEVLVEDDEPIERLEILNERGEVVLSTETDGNNVEWRPQLEAENGAYFLRVSEIDTNGDEPEAPEGLQTAVTSPIWVM